MMIWSALSRQIDRARRRPTWVERDGRHVVTVHGYSALHCLAASAAAAVVIFTAFLVLGVMP